MFNLVPANRSRELTRNFPKAFDEPFFRFFEEGTRDWNPPVEIFETKDHLIFNLEVPGFKDEDLDISYEDGLLTFTGTRTFEENEDHEYLRRERWYGKFQRSFRLPETADAEQVDANLKNGILTVKIPRKEEARPRQIKVKVS